MKTLNFIFLFLFTALQIFGACPDDAIAPDPIIVDSVSVDPLTGNATIGWEPSTAPDVLLYYIFIINEITGANDIIDSVYANQPTVYTYTGSNANGIVENLAIGVKDSCENESLTTLDYHNTIYVEHTIDICSASATLNWNSYDDFHSGTNVVYAIYLSTNSGSFVNVGSTDSLTYTYEGLQQGDNYQFYVQAIENSGAGPFTSSSNIIDVSGAFLIDPGHLYLYTSTVQDSSTNLVYFYVDTAADAQSYTVKRALGENHVFTTIGSVTATNGMAPMVEYYDFDIDAKNNSYFYKIEMVNECGEVRGRSNLGRTINLSVVSQELAAENTLLWNAYEGWLGDVSRYEVYRKIVGATDFEMVASIGATGDSIYTYVDNVSSITEGTGEFCYKIKAIEGAANRVDNLPNAQSWSNESCVIHNPVVFIANAFNPSGLTNLTFKPSVIFFDFESYQFTIYDRWGGKVFDSIDSNEAWNGKMNNSGNSLPTGTYVYILKLNSANGEEFVKRGTVTLVK